MVANAKNAVLLLAHGTPDSVDDIPEYMRNVTAGRPLADAVLEEVTHRYELIGRSPLTEHTLAQGTELERELGVPVFVGMRNWKPYIRDAVAQMKAKGIERAVAICLAPQNSQASVGLYKKAATEAAAGEVSLDFIDDWHAHPQLIAAFAEKLRNAVERVQQQLARQVPVIFTAHSVPTRTIEAGDPYAEQARETARLVAQSVGIKDGDWRFAFQSQGMSGGAWLGPTVEETIVALKQQGAAGVLIQPIGFLCDHVEVLYDIDIAFQQTAREQGMRLWRTESLNTSPLLISALADLARRRLAQPTTHAMPQAAQ